MIRAGAGLSTREDPRSAAEEAVETALAALPGQGSKGVEAALLFATPGYGDGLPDLLDAAVACLGTESVVGATAHGVLATGRESEASRAVSVLALSGLEAQPFLLPDLGVDPVAVAADVGGHLSGGPREEDLVVLLPDPAAVNPAELLPGLHRALGPARLVGAGASDPLGTRPLQWCGREIEAGAMAGIALRCPRPARIGVTQACRPASELLTVTRTRGSWILELEGRPALDVYREVARAPLAADLQRAATLLLVALPGKGVQELVPGSYTVRNVIGIAEDANAFAIPDLPRCGQQIALVLREPDAAREDLKAMLAGLGGQAPAFGLYLNCCARGSGFFGVEGLEAAYLENAFGAAPIAGMFGSFELGPIGGGKDAVSTELLTYTGVLALVDS